MHVCERDAYEMAYGMASVRSMSMRDAPMGDTLMRDTPME